MSPFKLAYREPLTPSFCSQLRIVAKILYKHMIVLYLYDIPAVIEGVPLVQVGVFTVGSIVACIGTASVVGDSIQLVLSGSNQTWGQRWANDHEL